MKENKIELNPLINPQLPQQLPLIRSPYGDGLPGNKDPVPGELIDGMAVYDKGFMYLDKGFAGQFFLPVLKGVYKSKFVIFGHDAHIIAVGFDIEDMVEVELMVGLIHVKVDDLVFAFRDII